MISNVVDKWGKNRSVKARLLNWLGIPSTFDVAMLMAETVKLEQTVFGLQEKYKLGDTNK